MVVLRSLYGYVQTEKTGGNAVLGEDRTKSDGYVLSFDFYCHNVVVDRVGYLCVSGWRAQAFDLRVRKIRSILKICTK